MRALGFLGKLLLIMALLFSLGAISGLMEKPGGNHDALVLEAALLNTRRTISASTDIEYIYVCRRQILARYNLTTDKVEHVEDLKPESPYHFSLAEVAELGTTLTGWEAAAWARETYLVRATEGASEGRKIALFIGAASGFLAGRWFVLARALNCHQREVVDSFMEPRFWQKVIRLQFGSYYQNIALEPEGMGPYLVHEHLDAISLVLANCANERGAEYDNESEFIRALKDYIPGLNDGATQIGGADVRKRTKLRNILDEVAASPSQKKCLFGSARPVSIRTKDIDLKLISIGPGTTWIRLGSMLFFAVFLSVVVLIVTFALLVKIASLRSVQLWYRRHENNKWLLKIARFIDRHEQTSRH